MGYTLEQQQIKERAKQIDLPRFLQSNGISLKKESDYYRHSKHSSLIILKSRERNIYNWIWNSQKTNGTAIDYLMNSNLEFNYNYNQAIKELNNFNGTSSSDHNVQLENFDINNIKLNKNISRTIAYLNKTRKIDNNIIQFCIDNKLISQTIEYTKEGKEIANLAFIIKDENNNIVGIEKNTLLSDSKFKGIEKNTKYGYGFTVFKTQQPKYIFYFESAIDLLSYIQIKGKEKIFKNLDKCVFVSLGGVKENILRCTQERYNNPTLYICTDNIQLDEASRRFVGQIKKKYDNVRLSLPQGLYKDWNDVIRDKI